MGRPQPAGGIDWLAERVHPVCGFFKWDFYMIFMDLVGKTMKKLAAERARRAIDAIRDRLMATTTFDVVIRRRWWRSSLSQSKPMHL